MATTLYQFVPGVNENFSFQPTFDGQQYTVVVSWSLMGQRWVVNIYSLDGALIMERALRSSPNNYNINLLQGYFTTSTMIYRAGTNNFEVSP